MFGAATPVNMLGSFSINPHLTWRRSSGRGIVDGSVSFDPHRTWRVRVEDMWWMDVSILTTVSQAAAGNEDVWWMEVSPLTPVRNFRL